MSVYTGIAADSNIFFTKPSNRFANISIIFTCSCNYKIARFRFFQVF